MQKKEEARKRIHALQKTVAYHNALYHAFDAPEISDAAYDALRRELESLEREFPEFADDVVSQKIGSAPLEKFEKVRHEFPMLSFADAMNANEIEEWFLRLQKFLKTSGEQCAKKGFYCELKIDGLAIELVYVNGILKKAITRGDGEIGEDITENIKTIRDIPTELVVLGTHPIPPNLTVRGEVYIEKGELARINALQEKNGLPRYANTRNLAAGSLRQLDSAVVAERKLRSFQYDIVGEGGDKTSTHEEKHKLLASWGFTVNKEARLKKSMKEVHAFRDAWEKKREKIPYEIDGIVVIVNDNTIFDRGGVVGKGPRAAIAYKFAPHEAATKLEDIHIQVGRTGVLTPVAVLAPVKIGGVTVSRATLHNFDEIKRLGIMIGDTVFVTRAGDVIPKIVGVAKDLRSGREKNFIPPAKCPVDGSPLRIDEALVFCSNPSCGARERESLYHFVSRGGFDIKGLGQKLLDKFADEGIIESPADIFRITEDDIKNLDRMGEKSAENVIREIKAAKKISPAKFIYALGIIHVGEETARALFRSFPFSSVSEFLRIFSKLKENDLEAVSDIGPKVSASIISWFSRPHNRNFLKQLADSEIQIKKEAAASERFSGKSFVFTGTLSSLSRDEAKDIVLKNGGNISESVSKKTSYVVVGDDPGSKYEKAKSLGISVLSEEEFKSLAEG